MANSQLIQAKVIKGSFTVLILTLLGSSFAYIVRILLSRTLSIEDYGLFYAVFGLFTVVITYIDLGFGYSIIYLLPKYIKLNNYAKAWNIFAYGQLITLSASFILSFVFIVFASFLSKNYFKIPGSEILIYIFCAYLISFTIIYSLTQAFGGMQKEKYYSSIAFIRWFLTVFFSLLFFIFGFSDIIYYAIALSIAHILTAFIYFFLLFQKHKFLSSNKIKWEVITFKEMLAFSLPALAETVVYSIVLIGDNFFLVLFRGVKEVGIYNIIYPLASIPIILINPLTTLILPLVSHLMKGEKGKLRYLLEKILQIFPFAGLYFSLFIIMFPSSSVSLIFGHKWSGLVEVPLTILCLGTIAILMSVILGAITLGTGEVKKKLKATLFASIINLSLNAFLIWQYGVIGAVITTSLFALILCVLFIRIIQKVIEIRIPYIFYLKLIIFSVFFYLAVRYINIQINHWVEFTLFGFLYTIIYILFGYILKLYNKQLVAIILSRKDTSDS